MPLVNTMSGTPKNIPTITDPKLAQHVTALVNTYHAFQSALDDDNFVEALKQSEIGSDMEAKYPLAWKQAAEVLGIDPRTGDAV